MINKIITQKAAATHTSKQMLDKLYLKSALHVVIVCAEECIALSCK